MKFEEIMSFNAPYNENNIHSLIEKIKSNCIVPYLGAGISRLFDDTYPLWNDFLNNLFDKYLLNEDRAKFESLNYEDKAEFLYSEIGNITFADELKRVFREDCLDRDLREFVDKPIYTLPLIFETGLLVTTNYDKAIERVYRLHQKYLNIAHPGHYEALNYALRENSLLLYKIHGDISEPQTSIVLTKKQYDEAYSNHKLISALSQAYISKHMLFLGCSMDKDRPIEMLRKISTPGMKNYAIISCKENVLKARRLELENEYFTQGIIYPDGRHECLKVILDYIAEKTNPVKCQEVNDTTYDNTAIYKKVEDTDHILRKTKKLIADFIEDHKKFENEDFSIHLKTKYFSKMTQEDKDFLFKELWERSFILNGKENFVNRTPIYDCLHCLYNENKEYYKNIIKSDEDFYLLKLSAEIFELRDEKDAFIEIFNFEYNSRIMTLFKFIEYNNEVYDVFNEYAKNIIRSTANSIFLRDNIVETPLKKVSDYITNKEILFRHKLKLNSEAVFLSNNISEHFGNIEKMISNYCATRKSWYEPANYSALFDSESLYRIFVQADYRGCKKEFIEFLLEYFGGVASYSQASRMPDYIKPYTQYFEKENYYRVLALMNNNNQFYESHDISDILNFMDNEFKRNYEEDLIKSDLDKYLYAKLYKVYNKLERDKYEEFLELVDKRAFLYNGIRDLWNNSLTLISLKNDDKLKCNIEKYPNICKLLSDKRKLNYDISYLEEFKSWFSCS